MEQQQIILHNFDLNEKTCEAQASSSDLEQQILNSKKRKAERKEKKELKKAKFMENISTSGKEVQAANDQQPDPNNAATCQFYLKKKARFCNQHPKAGKNYRIVL